MEIADIKHRLNIIEVATHLGIQINPRTKRALCPFHADKNPSLQFSQEKQICTCFSSNCHLGTVDLIGLTQTKLNTTTHEALKYLSGLAGETKAVISPTPEPVSRPKEPVSPESEESWKKRSIPTQGKRPYPFTFFMG